MLINKEKIIENWNNAVDNNDTVYILGDVNWTTQEEHDRIISKAEEEAGEIVKEAENRIISMIDDVIMINLE